MASLAIGRASDPVAKVLETMSGLLAKIIAEAEGVTKMYDEFAEWCEVVRSWRGAHYEW